MKSYHEIQGPSKAPKSDCIAFYKYDGMNFRAEWSKKRGWYKFGTRNVMIDESSPDWGKTIPLFLNKFGDSIPKAIKDNKEYRSSEMATVFLEMYTDNSFAGWFPQENGVLLPKFPTSEEAKMKLFDVNVHKKGFVVPSQFIKVFGHLDIAEVVYRGNFSQQFIQDVWNGEYPDLKEGVVAKGVLQTKRGSETHGIWMAKAKTKWWIDELKKRAEFTQGLQGILNDNEVEQPVPV